MGSKAPQLKPAGLVKPPAPPAPPPPYRFSASLVGGGVNTTHGTIGSDGDALQVFDSAIWNLKHGGPSDRLRAYAMLADVRRWMVKSVHGENPW